MKNNRYTGRPSLKWLFEDAKAEAEKILNDKDVATVVQDLNAASPEAIELLKKGKEDGNPSDDVVPVQDGKSMVGAYSPTQNEISLMKSVGYPLSSMQSLKNIASGDPTGRGKPIVTSERLVIDGHHRWSSIFAIAGRKGTVLVKNVKFPGKTAGEKLAKAQVAIVANVGTPVPTAPGSGESDNILGVGGSAIEEMIRANVGKVTETGSPLIGDQYLAELIPSQEGKMYFGLVGNETPEQAREMVIKKVAQNLSQLPQPAAGSPERALMPQFDTKVGGPDINTVTPGLQSGNINLNAPVVSEPGETETQQEIQKESVRFDLDRWKLLAGINKRG
jgi:hypothetical protein